MTEAISTSTTTGFDLHFRGIGMTRSQWDATHTAIAGFVRGSSYGPLLNGEQPTYGGVADGDHAITSYTVYVYPDPSRSEAIARGRDELPTDAVLLHSGVVSGGCYTEEYKSAAFAAETFDSAVILMILPPPDEQDGYYDITLILWQPGHFADSC